MKDLGGTPVAEYPRLGTYTLAELHRKRCDLADCHRRGGFLHLLHPVYQRLALRQDSDAR